MNTAAATATPIPRTAPLALWRVAEAFLLVLHNLFGGPERVAFEPMIPLKQHRQLASWLRCAEAMLRRLLAIEAAAYPRPNTRPLLRARRIRTRKPMSFSHDEPAKWRVSFRYFEPCASRRPTPRPRPAKDMSPALPGEPVFIFREGREPPVKDPGRARTRRPRQRAPRKPLLRQDRIWVERKPPPPALRSAWPLAERYEALLRAFNDPAPYARRLARRLHATPHRLAEALRAPPEAKHRIDRFDEMGEQSRSRWRAHFSSA